MSKKILVFLCLTFILTFQCWAQSIETMVKDLPPHFSILTTWGLRPEWDETSENIYFLNKMVGDVFKMNIKTRQITSVTSGFYHAETYGYNLETGKITNYTKSPGSYDEAEGIFPDGKYSMIESDRHQDLANRLQWKVDVYKYEKLKK